MNVSAPARPADHPGYSETFPCEAQSAAAARRLVRTAFAAWGAERVAEDGALVVTELVANAVKHTRGHLIRVTVTRPSSGVVRVGVVDKSVTLPVLEVAGDAEVRGRGLALVDALTVRWGTDLRGWGKFVWGELEVGAGE